MKYILLDTNIYINMLIDRRNNIKNDMLLNFIKLLNFDEIKLIVPSIVVHETIKNLGIEYRNVDKKLKDAKNSVNNICGINTGYSESNFDVEETKTSISQELNMLGEKYKENSSQIFEQICNILEENLFKHDNCIIIEENKEIVYNCLIRRIYKKAPFHENSKDCYADGIIIESLLYFLKNNKFNHDDKIFFVSDNPKDFSEKDNKESLDNDILKEIQNIGLNAEFKYVLQFNKLIGKCLKDEVNNANLNNAFEKEFEEDEVESYFDDMQRSSAGLTSLGEFEEKFIEDFRNSNFSNEIVSLSERFAKCYEQLEDFPYFYKEEFQNYLMQLNYSEISEFANKTAMICDMNLAEDNLSSLINIIERKADILDFSCLNFENIDSLDYGNTMLFYDKNKRKYKLKMQPLNLSCINGGMDTLDIDLFDDNNNKISSGSIEIIYGYVDYNDDNNVGDACGEEFRYDIYAIIEKITSIVTDLEEFVRKESEIVKKLKIEFNL